LTQTGRLLAGPSVFPPLDRFLTARRDRQRMLPVALLDRRRTEAQAETPAECPMSWFLGVCVLTEVEPHSWREWLQMQQTAGHLTHFTSDFIKLGFERRLPCGHCDSEHIMQAGQIQAGIIRPLGFCWILFRAK